MQRVRSRPGMMERKKQKILESLVFLALILLSSAAGPAQSLAEEFRRYLREQAAFSDVDFAALDRGATVVKLLPVDEKKQVSVCGVVRLQNVAGISMADLRESFNQKGSKSLLDLVKFSAEPVLDDLRSLKMEKRDIEEIKKC